jgi:uncharacterized membrane protein YeaQ/YmgE (transglycosylase-associated protein family)
VIEELYVMFSYTESPNLSVIAILLGIVTSWRKIMFGIITWIILGVIAGAIAKMIVPGRQGGGFLATAGLGIAGSFIGGAAHNLIKYQNLTGSGRSGHILSLGSIGVAVVGSIIAIFLWGLVMGRAEQ